MTSKVILVTGGTGLVGSAIQKVVQQGANADETWHFVSSKDANLQSESETRALFEKFKPTHVINLAANPGGLYSNRRDTLESFRSNMLINDNVLYNCYKFGVQKCVSCLSSMCFPAKCTYPVDETMIFKGEPHASDFAYANAKRMIDVLNRGYNKQHKCKFTCILPTNVFGPFANFRVADGGVLSATINKVYSSKKEMKPLVVWGSGSSRRQFIYSLDLARLIVWAVHNYDEISPIILSVEEKHEVTIKEVVEMVVEAFDFKGEVIFDTSKPDGRFKMTVSNLKMRKYLPDFQFTPIKQAIKETVDWFVENYEIVRK